MPHHPLDLSEWLIDPLSTKTNDAELDTGHDSIRKLRQKLDSLLYTASDKVVRDADLLKVLRYKNFNVDKAFRIFEVMHRNEAEQTLAHMPYGKGPRDYKFVHELRSFELLRHRNPKDGSAVVVIRLGEWTPDCGVDYSQVLQSATYIVDFMLEDLEIQKHGTTVILDYSGLHLSYILKFLPPSQIMSVLVNLQEGCPMKVRAIHVVNQPVTYNVAFALASPFISSKNQAKIKLHGSHVERLHEFIDESILPKDLLGKQDSDFDWFFNLLYNAHDEYVTRSKLLKHKMPSS